jgi:hypothetical protein
VAATALDAYLATVGPAAVPLVISLDKAIRTAHPKFDVAVKYRLLMYALDQDWHTWVCAIGVTKQSVGLRFLYGVLLDDPLHVLRAGSSVLKTWDFAFNDVPNAERVVDYVAEAVVRFDYYKANANEVLAASRAASTGQTKSTKQGT